MYLCITYFVGYVMGDKYYGAKACLNVWAPHVNNPNEFSLSQMWVVSGSFSNDLNTIQAGLQVSPELYGDGYPRFFIYWTTDAYQATGCYNLLCSGFVQTNNKIAIRAAISPTSSYNDGQLDISLLVWKIKMGDEEKIRTSNIFWTSLDGPDQFEDVIFYCGNCSLSLCDTYLRPHFSYCFFVILRPTII